MECDTLCVVRKLAYLLTYGLDVTGAIITQCVRGCTWHRFTALMSIALWHAVYEGTKVYGDGKEADQKPYTSGD